ncbi:vWA domain-containing protein [Murdochiella massiliensis]|uniref:vWA domain-containing protein n=1 Tax=Murdochiella massiliensis TaxID=1673723 RepID=UPI00082FCF14|nr:VWA domain-containing protein [Murdochiella massiliensis]
MEFNITSQNDRDILQLNEPHIPLLFLIDTAGSMHGEPIRRLNSGIIRLIELLSKSDYAKVIDLAVVAFSDHAEVIRSFLPSKVCSEIAIEAYGPTNLGAGLQTALDEVYKRRRKYMEYGVLYYKPRIILITDCNFVSNLPILQEMVKGP